MFRKIVTSIKPAASSPAPKSHLGELQHYGVIASSLPSFLPPSLPSCHPRILTATPWTPLPGGLLSHYQIDNPLGTQVGMWYGQLGISDPAIPRSSCFRGGRATAISCLLPVCQGPENGERPWRHRDMPAETWQGSKLLF